jgi:hypothetical protein
MKIKTLRGRTIDMTNIMSKHGKKRAIGNAKLNAQGDKLDKNGVVLKTHQQMRAEYNQASPKAVKNVPLHELTKEIFTPAEAVKAHNLKNSKTPRKMSDSE